MLLYAEHHGEILLCHRLNWENITNGKCIIILGLGQKDDFDMRDHKKNVKLRKLWNKKPTRCHLVLYLFLLYKLLNMFWATLCPSSEADDLGIFAACGVVPWPCRQSDPVAWLCVHWGVHSTTTYTSMDTHPANWI